MRCSSDVAAACWHTEVRAPATSDAGMATVYVVTAGSGDTYRIERVFLDGAEAAAFAHAYNGIAPAEPVHVAEWQTGAPPSPYGLTYWRGMVGSCPGELTPRRFAATDAGERFDDFVVRQEWWTGDALPDAKVVRRELAGVPKVEVVGLSKE